MEAHDHTKFAQNYSISSRDIAIFRFPNGRRCHLGFFKSQNFIANGVERVVAHQHANYCRNLSIGCEDIKIFRFFEISAAPILDFQIR